MAQPFAIGDHLLQVAPRHRADGGLDLEIDGETVRAELEALGEGRYRLVIDGRSRPLFLVVDGDRTFVHSEGRSAVVVRVDPLTRLREASRAARGGGGLEAPMPGMVVEVRARVGSAVLEGDTVLVIESMKLQTAIRADRAGRVSEVTFEVGQSFEQGAVLARIEREDDETGTEETPST